ncbi:MAG: glycosyltransferase [Thermoproteota archaeon]
MQKAENTSQPHLNDEHICAECKSELLFEQKVIRDKDRWFHARCFKSPIGNHAELESLDDSNIIDFSVRRPKLRSLATRCAFCKDDITKEDGIILTKKKIYHHVCFQLVGKTVNSVITKRSKEESKSRERGKIDPVLLLIAAGIFSLLFYTAHVMLSLLSLIAISIGMALSFYHIIDAGRVFSNKKHPPQLPSYFVFVTLVIPIVFGAIVAYDGYSVWYSAPKAIIVWGLTLTFWSNMVFIPLSIYSRYKESASHDNTYRPLISVIVPAYNEEKVIGRTVESVLNTNYPRKEIIVVDDGSTDNTLRILQSYKPKIKVIHKQNGGKYSALNYGLLYAKGEIVVTIDADTILAPESMATIVESFKNKEVGAVAGNIKVRNRVNWITWCQALEYVAGIQIFRRTLDFFNSVAIVPGALGAFRKSFLQKVGNFSKDNIAEDFDATLKILKSGLVVSGRINSKAYTEAPDTLYQFYKQRKRWYRGDMQVLTKHKNAISNPKFGTLYKLTYPLMLISMFITPFAGIIVWTFAIIDIISGGVFFVIQMLVIFIALQHLQAALAVRIEGEDPRLIAYSAFFVVGYKQIIDFMLMKSAIETLLRRKAVWTTVKRTGLKSK